MATKVVLSKLSPTMEEGLIVKWNKNEGDPIRVGDVLAEVETDKANMEMEALGAGVLRKILVPAGAKAPVGYLIGVVAGLDEDIAAVLSESTSATTVAPPPALDRPQAPPAAPSAAPETRPEGRIRASPLARRLASEAQVALESIRGTGPAGRIVKRDVLAFAGMGPFVLPTDALGFFVLSGGALVCTLLVLLGGRRKPGPVDLDAFCREHDLSVR